jgi:hypothetical protein
MLDSLKVLWPEQQKVGFTVTRATKNLLVGPWALECTSLKELPTMETFEVFKLLPKKAVITDVLASRTSFDFRLNPDVAHLWGAYLLRNDHVLFVERNKPGGYVTLHVIGKEILPQKDLYRAGRIDLFDCNLISGFLALLAHSKLHVLLINDTLPKTSIRTISEFDFLLRDKFFFNDGIAFLRIIPTQKRILFVNSFSKMVIYDLHSNQIPPGSCQNLPQTKIKQVLVEPSGTYCLIIHQHEGKEGRFFMDALDIASRTVVDSVQLPTSCTPDAVPSCQLFSLADELYLTFLHKDINVHFVQVKFSFDKTTTYAVCACMCVHL